MSSRTSRRLGFTLIELLVSLGILALLLSLALPAMQAARERARVLDCRSRMKQVALATQMFHDAHRALPTPLAPMTTPPFPRMLSPWAHLLPHLDQTALYQAIDQSPTETAAGIYPGPPSLRLPSNVRLLTTPLPVVVCPSDSTPRGGCNLRACFGSISGNERRQRLALGKGVWFQWQTPRRPVATLADVTDGLSQTVLLSERVAGDQNPARYDPMRDTYFFYSPVEEDLENINDYAHACATRFPGPDGEGTSFGGATWLIAGCTHTMYNHVLPPNSRIPDCAAHHRLYNSATTARSWHPGGVNVAFADGAARLIADSVDLTVWRAIGTRSGGDAVTWE